MHEEAQAAAEGRLAALTQANSDLARYKQLSDNVVSQQKFEQVLATQQLAAAAYKEAIAQRDTPTEQMEATAFYAGLTALRGMRAQSMEFTELNVEYGYSNESAAVGCDGIPVADLVDDIRVYQPSTRPGSPLPHAWIDDEDGSRRAIKDLVAPDRFLLIAGEDGEACCEAARALATEADLPLDAMRIGHVPAGAAA